MDKTTNLATNGNGVVMPGHFAGHLTAEMADDTTQTLWNSNVGKEGTSNDANQFHPNNKK